MNVPRWLVIVVAAAALGGLLLTQGGCPSAGQTPPSSTPGAPVTEPGPEATSSPAVAVPAPEEEKAAGEKPAEPAAEEKPVAPAAEEKPAATAPESKPVAEEKPAAAAEEKPAAAPESKPAAEEKPAAPAAEEKPAAAAGGPVGTPVEPRIPLGLPKLPIPEDNPLTEEKIALGKKLYFDKRLSKDGTISCATCHDPAKAWAEHSPTSTGIGGAVGGANSPTVINAAYAGPQFWDGRATGLEEQALGPIENPIEMGHKLVVCCAELTVIEEYKAGFEKAFGTPEVTSDRIAKAIASFERTVLSGNSPYDKYMAGDKSALNDAQKRGMELFESAGCAACHSEPLFSNYRFFNAGIGMAKEKPDEGRKAVTKKDSDLGKYRVAPLREVANTAPYFHDGSVATLEEAVKVMAQGGIPNGNLSPMMKAVGDEKLSEENIKNLVEFLKALSGEYPKE